VIANSENGKETHRHRAKALFTKQRESERDRDGIQYQYPHIGRERAHNEVCVLWGKPIEAGKRHRVFTVMLHFEYEIYPS